MNESNIEYTEKKETPEVLIRQAQTIDDLKEALVEIGPIVGTGRIYSPEKIIEYIDGVVNKKTDIHFITRAHGLRNKVRELLGLPMSENDQG